MRFTRYYLALILLLFCADASRAQLNVRTNLINRNLEVFFLSGIDRNSGASQPLIFEVFISGNLPSNTSTLQIHLELLKDNQALFRGSTDPFMVQQNELQPYLRVTNRQLFGRSARFRLVDGSLEDAGEELLKDILSIGKLPNGTYFFNIKVTDLTNPMPPVTADTDPIVISNPTKLDLIFPGNPVSGRRSDCQQIFTNLPQFRWEGDMRFYLVQVAEARRGEDPEDILNQEPRFRRLFAVGDTRGGLLSASDLGINTRLETIPTTSFQYPPSGEILTFRPGKTYLWRVIGIVNSSSGPIQVESEIYCFRIADIDNFNAGDQQLQLILRTLLGEDDYKKLFGDGGQLDGFSPKRIQWNGRQVNAAQLFFKIHQTQPDVAGYRVE